MANERRPHPFLALIFGLMAVAGMVAILGALSDGPPVVQAQSGTGVIRVATTGTDAPGCGSEVSPCRTVQYAVDQAQTGGEIRVATGIYTDVHVREGITQVVYISKTVAIRGGYTTSDWEHLDPETNPTTLDAQGQGRVLYITGDISPTIEGLRITGGSAFGSGSYIGGGIYVYEARAVISGCRVFNNTARSAKFGFNYGGGVCLQRSDSMLMGNTIISNSAGYGGGLYLYESDAVLSGNTIISNTAPTYGGGGLCVSHGIPQLSGNTIISNTANCGGGMWLWKSPALLSGNTIAANTAAEYGGGLYVHESDASLRGNLVISNVAGYGGGLYLHGSNALLDGNIVLYNAANYGGGLSLVGNEPTLLNMVVADNQAHASGSGLITWIGAPRLLHTTIARNNGGDGTGVFICSGSAIFTNTILVGHAQGVYAPDYTTATLEATLWGNGADWGGDGTIITGTRNYWGDPTFVDPDGGDYHIEFTSAALDRGVDAGVVTDMDGYPRPIGTGFDLGADEWSMPDLSPSRKMVSPERADVGDVLTYTVVLFNSGFPPPTNIYTTPPSYSTTTFFDAIPAHTTYISDSAQATSGILTYVGGGIHWMGTVTPTQAITITYRVTVNEQAFISNTALVTDRYGNVVTLTAYVNLRWIYLPLVLKEGG